MYKYKVLMNCYYGEGKKHRQYKKGQVYSSDTLKPDGGKVPKYFELISKGLQENINKKERELHNTKLELANEVEKRLIKTIAEQEKEIEELKKALKNKPKSVKEELCEMSYAQMKQFIKQNNIVITGSKNQKALWKEITKFKENKKLEEKRKQNGQTVPKANDGDLGSEQGVDNK